MPKTLFFVSLLLPGLMLTGCTSSQVAANAQDRPSAKSTQEGEIDFVKSRFKEHSERIPGMIWTVTHDYSDKSEADEIVNYFSSFMRGLHTPGDLTKLGGLQQVKEKFAAYTNSNDRAVSGFAAITLGIIGDKNFAPVVGRMLEPRRGFGNELDETTDGSRGQAAIALSLMGATEFEGKVVELLKTGNDFERSGAITALIGLGGKKHAKAVLELMLDKEAYAVDKIAPLNFLIETETALEHQKELIDLMQKGFDSEQRKAIMFLFARLDAKDTKDEIAKLLDTEFVKGDAAKALALLNGVEYQDKIAQLLSDPKPLVRKDAALALGLLRAQMHAGAVSNLLSSKEDFVQLYAAIALVMMDSKAHLSAVLPVVDGFKRQKIKLNEGDFHPFVAERAQNLIKEFDAQLAAARAGN